MSSTPPADAAERRLHDLLALIRQAPPEPLPDISRRVVASARWERGVRSGGHALGGFGSSLIGGLALLLGIRRTP